MQLSIQKEEAKKKEVHVEENVPAPSPRSNGSVFFLHIIFFGCLWYVVRLLIGCMFDGYVVEYKSIERDGVDPLRWWILQWK